MATLLLWLVDLIVNTVTIILILNALMSFAPLDPWHPVRRTLAQISEPIVRPFRNIVPQAGMFDFSPMLALLVVQLAGRLLRLMILSAF